MAKSQAGPVYELLSSFPILLKKQKKKGFKEIGEKAWNKLSLKNFPTWRLKRIIFLHPGIEFLKKKKSLKKLGSLQSSYFRTL